MGAWGFTIQEMLAVLSIISLLVTVAIQGFSIYLPTHRLNSAARHFYSSFQLAKLTAVKRRCPCTVTFNLPIEGTIYDCVVYVDADGDLEYDTDATTDGVDNDGDGLVDEDDVDGESEEIISRVRLSDYENVAFDTGQGGGDGLTFTQNSDGLPSISFRPDGFTKNNTGGFGAGTIHLKNSGNKTARVVVSSLGRIRVE